MLLPEIIIKRFAYGASYLKIYRERAVFSVSGPRLWKKLPFHIRKSRFLAVFKTQLNTYLFTEPQKRPGYPDNENQSQDRTETIDSNIFKSSQSNVGYKTMK